ncbi:MAG: serine/threonine protein kinase [Planctomycetes bacterium]|nr:serine/threonine protein kinase [Planctomycetota bacterium]
MTGTAGHSRRIVRLVERALRELEASGEAGLAALLREHPEAEAEVRARLELLARSGLSEPQPAPPRAPTRLGEFVPLERLGEGGMGVVWRARQESLGRTVALKVIRPEYLWFEGARARFRREAESVAKLRHPGIVPLYAFGEQDGVPYLAFELVEGLPLDRLIAELLGSDPTRLSGQRALEVLAAHDGQGALAEAPPLFAGGWLEVALRLAIAIGDSLAHAHSRGVLHRDLKPSNVMVTRGGEVKLLDFGLASSEGSERMTREGSAPGSLAYMAPELIDRAQVRADVRSEVYALGVVLYELLALKAPFEGGSVESVRARILGSQVEPLARRNPGVPWELLAIVECAMERDPARRYADVTAMVEDLQRAARKEPIRARRASWLRRAWRAVQRHPVLATAFVLGSALVIAVPLTYAFQQTRIAEQEAREAERVRAALLVSDRERTRAEESELDLLTGVDRFFVQVAALKLENIPGADGVRRSLMAEAQILLKELAERTGLPVQVTRALAKARVRQAELLTNFNQLDEALAVARAGLALCERVLADRPADVEMLRFASLVEAVIANIATQREDAGGSLEATRRSLAWLERAAKVEPESWHLAEQIAIRAADEALGLAMLGELEESVERFESSEESYARCLALCPEHFVGRFRIVSRTNWAAALALLGRMEEARGVAELALADFAAAIEKEPSDVDTRNSATTLWRILRNIAEQTQDAELEERAAREAAELASWAFERFPQRSMYRIEYVESQTSWANLKLSRGDEAASLELFERAHAAARALRETQSNRTDALIAYCGNAQSFAAELVRRAQHARCAEVAGEALPLALELLDQQPERRGAVVRLGLLQADALARCGQLAEAVAALRTLHEKLPLRRADLREDRLGEALRADAGFLALRAELPE